MSSSSAEARDEPRKRRRIEPVVERPSAEPDGASLALYAHSSSTPSHHQYSTINAAGQSSLHLGDVHYHASPPSASAKDQLMATLHFPEMFKRWENIQDRHNNTFEWILEPPKNSQPRQIAFREWLRQTGGLYWISGKPGSGKSVLTKYLAQYARQNLRRGGYVESPIILSFWFWEAAHTRLERNLFGCLRSLLWQLLNHPLHGNAICKEIGGSSTFEWTLWRLREALKDALILLARLDASLLIFLDGLDECGDSGRDVLTFATGIVKQHNHLKMCVSSRPEPLFQVTLSAYPHLRMQDLNQPDIHAIIDQDLLQTPEFDLIPGKEHQSQYLRDKIADMAQGVLLWVRLVIRGLLQGIVDGDTFLELQDRLVKMPPELEGENGLYAFMLKRNAAKSKSYLTDAAFYLQIAGHRDMSVIEFRLASNDNLRSSYMQLVDGWERLHFDLDCDGMARAVSARTAGLLEVIRRPTELSTRAARTRCAVLTNILNIYEDSRVDFIHRTARTYIFETSAGHQILAACTKSLDAIKHICFETWLVSRFVFASLESIAPIGLPHFTKGWTTCKPCNASMPEICLLQMKHTVGQLGQKGLLWTMPYQSLHWTYWGHRYLPWDRLNEQRIGFASLFACFGIWEFAEAESSISVSDPSSTVYLVLSIIIGLYGEHIGDGNFSKTALKLCDETLCLCPDPNSEVVDTDGERIPAFHPIAYQYATIVIELQVSSIEAWLQRASVHTRTRRCKPTMGQCSRYFYEYVEHGRVIVFGAFSYADVAPLLPFTIREECSDRCSVNPDTDTADTACILWNWPKGAWRPEMHNLPPSDGTALLQGLVRVHEEDPGIDMHCDAGTIYIYNYELPDWSLAMLTRFTELRSLFEVFQVLGKTTEAIHSFAAAEDNRMRITYDEVIYRHWRSWMHGEDDLFLQQYEDVPRPDYLLYSLNDEGPEDED